LKATAVNGRAEGETLPISVKRIRLNFGPCVTQLDLGSLFWWLLQMKVDFAFRQRPAGPVERTGGLAVARLAAGGRK
jgi:hypothetical protein